MYRYNGIIYKNIKELREVINKYAIPTYPSKYQLDVMGVTEVDNNEVTNGTIISD